MYSVSSSFAAQCICVRGWPHLKMGHHSCQSLIDLHVHVHLHVDQLNLHVHVGPQTTHMPMCILDVHTHVHIHRFTDDDSFA